MTLGSPPSFLRNFLTYTRGNMKGLSDQERQASIPEHPALAHHQDAGGQYTQDFRQWVMWPVAGQVHPGLVACHRGPSDRRPGGRVLQED
ncbi:hypothetical protein ACLOJK_015307 [Asimina triloba]